MEFKKLFPYQTVIKENSFRKYEGFYFDGFVHFVFFLSFIFFLLFIYMGTYLLIVFPIVLALIAYSNFFFTEIDFKNKRFKEGYYFLGTAYGDWKPIPEMKYLSIIHKRTTYDLIDEDGVVGKTSRYNYELEIFVSHKKYIVLLDFHKIENARRESKIIAKGLNEKLLDVTVNPSKFLIE